MLLFNDGISVFRTPRRAVRSSIAQISAPRSEPLARRMRHVALLIESSGSYGRGLLQGIARYNRDRGGWSTYFRPHGLNEPPPLWLRNWDGDGLLIRGATPELADIARCSGLPVVNVRSASPDQAGPSVVVDNREIARLAFAHLRERGLRNFAFCGKPEGINRALDQRKEFFQQVLHQEGITCHTFPAAATSDWELEQEHLADWIGSLPKPVGVMACNDERGLHVLDACRRCGVAVPDDVAVIGVDNDQPLCELAIPPLTSIDVNAETVGYEAAALLDRMMNGEKPPHEPLLIAPRGVVPRRSTDIQACEDEDVSRAIGYIRENACRGLQVLDVLSFMGISRAALQQRMKQIAGRTIHQEIQRVRVARVQELLAMSDVTIKQVARESGFASVQYLTRVFHSATGETPARYRQRRAK